MPLEFEWDKHKASPVVRGKYAAAFRKGVRVTVHTAGEDQVHRVTRRPDGTIKWQPIERNAK